MLKFLRPLSFHRYLSVLQVLVVVVVLISCVALTVSTVSTSLKNRLMATGENITRNLAQQSVLALLFSSEENVIGHIEATLSLPEVVFMGVYDLEANPLVTRGESFGDHDGQHMFDAGMTGLNLDEEDHIDFFKPVIVTSQQDKTRQEILGYVSVKLTKVVYFQEIKSLVLKLIAIGVLLVFLSVIVIVVVSRRLTQPLSILSSIMQGAREGEQGARATNEGPKEIQEIAQSFNSMMDSLEEHSEQLAQRVDELELARLENKAGKERLSSILANVAEGIVIVRSDYRIESINHAGCRLLGRESDTLVGVEVEKFFPTLSSILSDLMGSTVRIDNPFAQVEMEGVSGKGSALQLEMAISCLKQGRDDLFIIVFRDIAQRKQYEQELKSARDQALHLSQLKTNFMANMSHEIRTPMNGIVGTLELMGACDIDEEVRDYVTTMKVSSQQMMGIINDILDFAKIESGQMKIEYIEVCLADIYNNICNTFGRLAEAKGLQWRIQTDEALPDNIVTDPVRLLQIINNILSNAIKFTSKGFVSVNCRLQQTNDGDFICFEIEDSGVGIAEHARIGIFQPFQQEDGSTTRRYGGTGLGLSICKYLVELMSGTIGVESMKGKGSRFWFRLPLNKETNKV